ncbi:hypothetical protein Droror1_Dr00016070 [Drosera rotundifolia]
MIVIDIIVFSQFIKLKKNIKMSFQKEKKKKDVSQDGPNTPSNTRTSYPESQSLTRNHHHQDSQITPTLHPLSPGPPSPCLSSMPQYESSRNDHREGRIHSKRLQLMYSDETLVDFMLIE